MARSIWNGTITFGMRQRADQGLLGDGGEDHPLPRGAPQGRRPGRAPADLLEGGQGGRRTRRSSRATRSAEGKYVVLDKDEIKAAAGDRGKVDRPRGVRRRGRDRPRVLREDLLPRPAGRGEDAYRAAARGARAQRAAPGIGRFIFHDREYLVARPARSTSVLALHTLRFHDEVVDAGRPRHRSARRSKPSKREIEMADQLVESLRDGVRPERVRGHLPRGGPRR